MNTSALSPAEHAAFSQPHDRGEHFLVRVFLASTFVLLFLLDFHYRIDSDESQHLHVVWGWAHGLLQYRDVFDNHTPLFHLLCTPLFLIFGERPSLLFYMRLAMLPLYGLILWSTYRIGRALFSRRVGLWAAVFSGLLPGFLLCAIEFRTDDLWTALWLSALAVLVNGRLTFRRSFLLGLLLGATLAASLKTTLLLAALGFAVAMVMLQTAQFVSRFTFHRFWRCLVGAGLGFLIVPSAIMLFFVARGAWAPFLYGTVQHNLLPHMGRWRRSWASGFLFPATLPFMWLGAHMLLDRASNIDLGVKRAVIFLTAAVYLSALVSFWPLLTREDFLPFYPLLILFLTPAVLATPDWVAKHRQKTRFTALVASPRFPALVAGTEIILVLIGGQVWRNDAQDEVSLLTEVLRLTEPSDFVIDLKGETVFRERAFYYALEGITKERLRRGLITDDIPERLIATHTAVAVMDKDVFFPSRAQDFLRKNYLPVGRLWVAGQQLALDNVGVVTFTTQLPLRYALVAEHGGATGWLDGTEYTGARLLAPGPHEFRSSAATGRIALVWAQAIERNFSPFSFSHDGVG